MKGLMGVNHKMNEKFKKFFILKKQKTNHRLKGGKQHKIKRDQEEEDFREKEATIIESTREGNLSIESM